MPITGTQSLSQPLVFISYAHEDTKPAMRLYRDLRALGARPWIDREDLVPGVNWRDAIREAITEARFFLALMSSMSIGKRGYVQRELRNGLDMLQELPYGRVYLIPIRLDECVPTEPRLKEIHWVDMFESWEKGFARIAYAIQLEPDVVLSPTSQTASISPEEYFNGVLPLILDYRGPEALKIEGSVLFHVRGKDSSDWTIVFDRQRPHVVVGTTAAPDLTVDISRSSVRSMLEGTFNAVQALEDGDVKVAGRLELLKEVGALFKSTGQDNAES